MARVSRRLGITLLFFCCCASARAQTVVETKPGLVKLEVEFSLPTSPEFRPPAVVWRTLLDPGLDRVEVTSEESGWSVFVFVARPGETHHVDCEVIDWQAQSWTRKTFIVKAPVSPDPTPDPTPDETELTRDVRRLAASYAALDRQKVANSFSEAAEMADSRGSAVVIKSLEKNIEDLDLSEDWQRFFDWLNPILSSRAQSRDQIQIVYPQIAEGLR